MSFFTLERSDFGGIIKEMRGEEEEGKKRGIKGGRMKLEKHLSLHDWKFKAER